MYIIHCLVRNNTRIIHLRWTFVNGVFSQNLLLLLSLYISHRICHFSGAQLVTFTNSFFLPPRIPFIPLISMVYLQLFCDIFIPFPGIFPNIKTSLIIPAARIPLHISNQALQIPVIFVPHALYPPQLLCKMPCSIPIRLCLCSLSVYLFIYFT